MSRVIMVDEAQVIVEKQSNTEVAKANQEVLKVLTQRRQDVNQKEKDEDLKEALQANDDEALQALLAKKKAEKSKSEDASAKPEPVPEVRAVPTSEVKPEPAPTKVIEAQRSVSLNFGVVGVGQAGSKIAKVFYDLGYDACVLNTAKQDLDLLELPGNLKYFMDYSIGGAGRDRDVGQAAVEANYSEVESFISENLNDCEVLVLCMSGGGGTGSGAAKTMVDMLQGFECPLVVMYILPGSADDSQSKHNAINTLADLAAMSATDKINSLVLVDNAKIELAYPELSQAAFWKTANNAIVEPLHMFNSVSAKPTDYEALDSMDFAKAFIENGGCTLFGSNKVSRDLYEEDETALVEAIIDNLERGLLASGFDLKEAQSVGILVTAKQEVLERLPYRNISYIFKYISSEYDSARSFKGVYARPTDSDDISIHFVFSGLGLPKPRVESLKIEAEKHMDVLKNKKRVSNESMNIDMGKDATTSAADEMMSRIKRKKGAIGKLITKSRRGAVDRRR